MKKHLTIKNIFLVIIIILALYVNIYNLFYIPLQRYKYFTNQSNLLVLIVSVMMLFKINNKTFKYLSFITLISIVMTGIIYNVLLRTNITNTLEIIQNELTHIVIPIFYTLIYYIFNKTKLEYKEFYIGLIHPILYLIIFSIVGHFTNKYPYDFLNVKQYGYTQLLIITPSVIILIFIAIMLKKLTTNKDV